MMQKYMFQKVRKMGTNNYEDVTQLYQDLFV